MLENLQSNIFPPLTCSHQHLRIANFKLNWLTYPVLYQASFS